ncbi:tripartite tricarboxylate transporter substrate binding protein [Bordetella petrii]|uniref:tripartite tricarboxylate transporter substrate binding protein n=1 Tax=Bordetella petrii TaxID=94624 RepID=UPI001E5418CD|nr:tripartite tricarboxylate transporter substrate binding protein [Bordetella petrii]MCD0502006.1 tripartite tricarboxylate transporter substrate binding protein [Bordetella petrii]
MHGFFLRPMRALATLACLSALHTPLQAAPPIRLEVGFPPGGTTDVMARLIANELSTQIGRDVIVENRAGASGNIAASSVAQAAPDGNTLLFAPSSHAVNASLYPTLPFDTANAFTAIGMVATTPYVLVVNPKLPHGSVGDLTRYLKQHPGEVAFASASPGTGQHLAGELFKKSADVDILHVPYKGSSAALPDLIAGRTGMMFDNIAVMLPHIKSGKVDALAVTTAKRSSLLPDRPTVAESGYPGFDVMGWFVLLAPAQTPADVVDTLNQGLNTILRGDRLAGKLAELGAEVKTGSPQEADQYVRNEIARWAAVVKEAGIKPN